MPHHHSGLFHRLACWAGPVVFGLALALPGHARVVGLVLDDSGSMAPIFERAQFATQLLVSVLDAEDRLYLVRLNGDGGQVSGPLDLGDRPALLAHIRNHWQALRNNPTPYAPLEATLAVLVNATRPGEEARLLVITDGEFTDPPPVADLRQRLAAHQNAFRGKNLAVHFVALHHQRDVRAVIAAQGVRDALLTTFNGSPDSGRIDIERAQAVFPELRRAITELYGADAEQRGTVVRLDAQHLHLHPPFSIRRLVVAVADERGHEPARFQATSFALRPDPPPQFQPATALHRANVYHLQPAQPLLPGADYQLTFDRPLPPDTQVLFDSGLELELRFFVQGQPVTPDAQGRLTLAQDTPLEVRATLIDRLNPQASPVLLSTLPQTPVFTLSAGPRSQPMTLDPARNDAYADVRYPTPGAHTLTVQARYPGFVTRRAQDVLIDVRPFHPVALALTGERRDGCADCAADETRAIYTRQPDYRDLFALTLQAKDAPATAAYRLELAEPLPEGVRLLLPDGQTALSGATRSTDALTLTPGQPVQARLQYNRDYRARDAQSVRLSLQSERADWPGQAALQLHLRPHNPAPRWREAGHTGSDPAQPFQIAVTELSQRHGLFLVAENLLRDLEPAHLRPHSPTLNLALQMEGPERVRVMPEKSWGCDCFTPAGDHAFTLDYADPETRQTAHYAGTLRLNDAPWLEKCGLETLLLLTMLLILTKTACILRTQRFPPRSRLVVLEAGKTGPVRRIRLHSGWTALLSCRDERRRADGLYLRALPHGAAIRCQRHHSPTLCFEETGETLAEACAGRSQRERFWHWGEALKDDELGLRYVLVKDIRQFRPDAE